MPWSASAAAPPPHSTSSAGRISSATTSTSTIPGYWDSWPSLNGAIGMTFETDGGPAIRVRKSDGSVTTFGEAISRHYVASMATLATLAAGSTDALQAYYEFRASGMAEARNRPFKRVVIAPTGDPTRLANFLRLMTRQRIEVTRTTQPFTSTAAHDFLAGGPAARKTFPAGSYVIDLAQPQARLATAILEPAPALDSRLRAAAVRHLRAQSAPRGWRQPGRLRVLRRHRVVAYPDDGAGRRVDRGCGRRGGRGGERGTGTGRGWSVRAGPGGLSLCRGNPVEHPAGDGADGGRGPGGCVAGSPPRGRPELAARNVRDPGGPQRSQCPRQDRHPARARWACR